jgi:multidrug efflux pump subunit AcrA (membrane-fusion protein)
MDPKSQAEPAEPPPERTYSHERLSSLGTMLVLQSRAFSHDRFATAAAAVTADLAVLLRCERVSLGLQIRQKICVTTISGVSDLRAKQDAVRHVANAMQEALDQRCAIVHPQPPETTATVALAHDELARSNGGLAICTLPILCGPQAAGALTFERRDGFDADSLQIAKDAALFVGPVLVLQRRAFGSGSAIKGRSPWPVAAAAAAVAVIVLGAWPMPYRVVAAARVEGEAQRVIAAPVDGYVRAVAARPGQAVQIGEVIVQLEDQDLTLEREKWESEIAKLDKQYRDALSKDEAGPIVISGSKLDEARAQLALAQRQLERTALKAPFDGVLISGDLSQSIGMPVKRGQELMTMATQSAYRIVAEVDEQDIAALRIGQKAQVLFAALPEPVLFHVARIAPVATTADGRNVFEVESNATPVAASTAPLRPGLRGVAKIEIEPSFVAAVWWRRASHWLRHTTWRLVG